MHGNGNRNATVEEQIRKRNPWYVGSHFEWAEKPSIRPIYEKRFRYFVFVGHTLKRVEQALENIAGASG